MCIRDRALTVAVAHYPNHEIRDIRVMNSEQVDVYFHAPERNTRAVHKVSVNPVNGTVESVIPTDQDESFWTIFLPIHSGEWLPILGKILILFSGIALITLSFTGPIMWWQARRLKAMRRGNA